MGNNPLVSCIMPTFNRADFIDAAIDCFLKQTYENKELIILDDSSIPIRLELSSEWPITNIILPRTKLGQKRNIGCELARGDIIYHFDDDDWSAPERIERQLATLQASGKPVTGYSSIYYWHIEQERAALYRAFVGGYVCGGTLCYRRDWWERNKFPSVQTREDNPIVYGNLKNIEAIDEPGMYVARTHDSNTGGDKSHTGKPIDRALIPIGFWSNEKLRQYYAQPENRDSTIA